MVVAGMAASAQQTMVNLQINITGNYDLFVKGANKKITVFIMSKNGDLNSDY